MNKFKKVLFVSDAHAPHQNKKVFNIIKKVARDEKPDMLCYLGDMFDAEAISKFSLSDFEDGIYQTEEEIHGFKKDYHEPLLKACGKNTKVLWALGNHDGRRITDTLEKIKAKASKAKYEDYAKKLDLRAIFPDVSFKDYNDCHQIGKLYATHGEYHNVHHTAKHVHEYMANVIYGHLHTNDCKTIKSKAKNLVRTGYSIPCACELDYSYMKNRSSSWVNGFAFAYVFPNGFFNLFVITIINNRCVWNGKVYNGRK